jgi:hypothetical protein
MQHSDGGRSIADGGDEELNAFALAVSRAIGFGSASHLSEDALLRQPIRPAVPRVPAACKQCFAEVGPPHCDIQLSRRN